MLRPAASTRRAPLTAARWLATLAAMFSLTVFCRPSPAQTPVYSQQFEGAIGPEWSTSVTRATSISGKHLGPLGNGTVTLDLSGLLDRRALTISFDLLILGSWDGNADVCCGPDLWTLRVSGGPTQIRTTFAGDKNNGIIISNMQVYPGSYPGYSNPARTGAVKIYGVADGVPGTISDYRLTYTFPHQGASARIEFIAETTEGYPNEGWGLDNVKVDTAPPGGLKIGAIDTLSGDGKPGTSSGLPSSATRWTPPRTSRL